MALITSAASGNFNAGATWTGGVVPGVGDEAQAANGHTVTITANATCDEVSNAGTGIFTLNDGVTLTANITSKSTTATRNCLQFTAGSPAAASIVGNVTGGSANGSVGVAHTGTGTLTITGNCTGGSNNNATAVSNTSNGLLQITGNAVGGSATINCFGVNNASTGTVTLTGNTTGGTATNSFGANNASTGILTIIGIATGGIGSTAAGANNASTGILNLGRAKGNAFGPSNSGGISASVGAANVGLGIIEIQGLEYGDFGMSPTSGTGIRLKKVSTNQARFNYVDSGSAKTLVDATQGQMPAASDVRHGVSYASGALTGTCRVPTASSVASGVLVDNTTGTAVLTAAAVQSALTSQGLTTARASALDNLDATVSSRLAPNGTLATVTNLTNAPASVTPSDIWSHATRTLTSASGPTAVQIRQEIDANSTKLDAAISTRLAASAYTAPTAAPTAAQNATAVRTELATELARVDAAISSRATPANIPTTGSIAAQVRTELTPELAKVSALNTDRLAQVSTVSTTGAQLAAALS